MSDEEKERSLSPDSGNLTFHSSNMTSKVPNNAHRGGTIATPTNSNHGDAVGPDVQALKELLQKEENKLNALKTLHVIQGSAMTNSKTSIQGSALNKKGSRSSGGGSGGGSGRNSPILRPAQPKHSIVVVRGHQPKTSTSSSSSSSSSGATGISSRLQQLVDNIAVDQTRTTSSERLHSSGKDATAVTVGKMMVMSTPPVPGLTSIVPSTHSQQKHSVAYISSSGGSKTTSAAGLVVPQIRPKVSNIRSSHEVITISDSPVSKNPPPLLSSSAKMNMTTNGSIQVHTISSTVMPSNTVSGSNSMDRSYLLLAAEQSRRYREYLLKQNLARKNFQKQIERKMVLAPYPKTFRQIWPLIPVHDSGFVRHYGLEAVSHHFDSASSTAQDKTVSKVKPICNQCGCDFASAWQIRKSNSKQLLLCEACDFQNLKILQRSKLGNQLKELLESIRKEEEKFGLECEEARKQVLMLEKRATESPPPLLNNKNNSDYVGHTKRVSSTIGQVNQVVLNNQISSRVQALANTAATISGSMKKHQQQMQHRIVGKNMSAVPTVSVSSSNSNRDSAIPSILGQKSSNMSLKKEVVVVGSKRKEPSPHGGSASMAARQEGTPPPSKVYKPGSVLDQTLNRLSKQLITRKLDEQRKECVELMQVKSDSETTKGTHVAKPGADVPLKPEYVAAAAGGAVTTSAATSSPGGVGEKSKSRRKGTPKHRLFSGSGD